jgi:anti-anti-sigma factor
LADEVLAVQVSAVADGEVVLTVTGEVDVLSAPVLQRALDTAWETDPRHVTVDLRGVTFLNAPGMRLLQDARQAADDRGARLEVRTGPGRVARLLWRIGLGGTADGGAVAEPGRRSSQTRAT